MDVILVDAMEKLELFHAQKKFVIKIVHTMAKHIQTEKHLKQQMAVILVSATEKLELFHVLRNVCYKSCTYNGKTYANAETFNATDGCNTCKCDGTTGKVTCTQIKCPTDPYQGWKTYTSEVFKYSVKYPSDAEISPDNEDACCITTISLAGYNHLQQPNKTIQINSYDESSDDDIQRKLNEIKGYGWKDDKYTVTNSTIGGYSATSVEGYLYMGIRDAGGSPVYSYGTYILVKPNKDLHIIAAWDDEIELIKILLKRLSIVYLLIKEI